MDYKEVFPLKEFEVNHMAYWPNLQKCKDESLLMKYDIAIYICHTREEIM